MFRYLHTLGLPLLITVGVFVAGHVLDARVPMRDLVPYLIMTQVVAMVMAGKRVVLHRLGGMWQAALAPALMVLAVDVTLKAGLLAWPALKAMPSGAFPCRDMLGVLAAFLVFLPALLFCGYVGGVNARRELRRRQASVAAAGEAGS